MVLVVLVVSLLVVLGAALSPLSGLLAECALGTPLGGDAQDVAMLNEAGLARRDAGRGGAAEACFRAALSVGDGDSRLSSVLSSVAYNLALTLHAAGGRVDEAVAAMGRAAELAEAGGGSCANCYHARAHWLAEERRYGEAVAMLSQLVPRFEVDSFNHRAQLGAWLSQVVGDAEALRAAERELRAALAFEPGEPRVTQLLVELSNGWNRLSIAAREAAADEDDWDVALLYAREATRLDAQSARLAYNRGSIYFERGDCAAAVDDLWNDVALGHNDTFSILGACLVRLGRTGEAKRVYARGMEAFPEDGKNYHELASLYNRDGRGEDAAALYRRVLARDEADAHAHHYLAQALTGMNRDFETALAHYRRSLELEPDSALYWYNYGSALFHSSTLLTDSLDVFRKAVQLDPAMDHAYAQVVYAADMLCAWDDAERETSELERRIRYAVWNASDAYRAHMDKAYGMTTPVVATPLQAILYDLDGPTLRRNANQVARLKTDRLDMAGVPYHQKGREEKRRRGPLRIGLVSSDFRGHPVGRFVQHVFRLARARGVEMYAYSHGKPSETEVTPVVRATATVFRDLYLVDHYAAARTIADDALDILIELNGWTESARMEILALRPAPVQMSYLGFPGTTGADAFIDYYIGDPLVTPAVAAADAFSEKIIYLGQYQVNHHALSHADLLDEEEKEEKRVFTFGNLNQNVKNNVRIFSAWMEIMRRVPGARLVLYEQSGGSKRNIRRQAAAAGVDGDARIEFVKRVPERAYLERARDRIDLFLDTDRYNAHCTASDVLWAGVPVLTLTGPVHKSAARVATSLIRSLNCGRACEETLIVDSYDAYIEHAVRLATDDALYTATRAAVANARASSRLFNSDKFLDEFLAAMHAAVEVGEVGKVGGGRRHIVVV